MTLPFVVRAVQPVLLELDEEMEEAAASLGAGPLAVFRRIVFPNLLPAILSGVALAFARAVGEFGAVVLISGNIPFKTEVSSVYIFGQLQSGNTCRRRRGLGGAARDLARASCSADRRRSAAGRTRHDRCLGTSCASARSATWPSCCSCRSGSSSTAHSSTASAPAWDAVTTPEAIHALELTLLMAAIAVPANTVFGVVLALALVRGPLRRDAAS